MGYVTHDGVRIYYEVEGDGPPLLLHHGWSRTGQRWREGGYVAALRDHYYLILIDARGHGRSDKPHDPAAYLRHHRASDVSAVLDALAIARVCYWGHSMGGEVGFALGQRFPERVNGLILGGYHPYSPPAAEAEPLRTWPALVRQGLNHFLAERERATGPWSSETRAQWLANDGAAIAAWVDTMRREADGSLAARLETMPMPCLLDVGAADPFAPGVARTAAALSDATLVSFPGLDHSEVFPRIDLVLPPVRAFLARIARDTRGF